MLVCKHEKFSGPWVRNMRAFGNFSSDIPRRDMPDNNFTGHARIHVRYAYIPSSRLMGKSSKINDFVKFSARFRSENTVGRTSQPGWFSQGSYRTMLDVRLTPTKLNRLPPAETASL
ncbi:hypothetical protein PUN28_008035 [Cardiocondyla obscurior]|uniref:Uncharacterized protein n=1 Tax=Cardiocondyla obscurior TaxID=286306 RepID=A0AAW2FX90_9HYME